ncbi:MAG: hypothetical protein HYV28_01535 [Ignavibacteriales bacterium]|nr:hypothetical protein [Ignavibacteriales bacterium]
MEKAINREKLFSYALYLAVFTIAYNLAEGFISVYFGMQDETLSLFGFGTDSFIEVISGIGIASMITRIRGNSDEKRNGFENTALKITGAGFYVLTAGLAVSALLIIITGHKPETTFWGVVISLVSIAIMYWLYRAKLSTGKKLDSLPIISDANCTKVCIYMSVALLAASGLYELTGIGYVDALGSLALAWFSYSEGKECFEKIRGNTVACTCHNS